MPYSPAAAEFDSKQGNSAAGGSGEIRFGCHFRVKVVSLDSYISLPGTFEDENKVTY